MNAFDHTKSDPVDAMGVASDRIQEFTDGVIAAVAKEDNVTRVIERVSEMLNDQSENGEITRRIVAAIAVSAVVMSVIPEDITLETRDVIPSIVH